MIFKKIMIDCKNIQGLKGPDFILKISQYLTSDIVFLQESQLRDAAAFTEVERFSSLRDYNLIGSFESRTMIFVRKEFEIVGSSQLRGDDVHLNQYLSDAKVMINDLCVQLINVYTPSQSGTRGAFFEYLSSQMPRNALILLGGDFNCILNPLDQMLQSRSSSDSSTIDLRRLVQVHRLHDTYRVHPDTSETQTFTNFPGNDRNARRLDRFYVSWRLVPWCGQTVVDPSDTRYSTHRKVSVSLKNFGTEVGRGCFQLGTSVVNHDQLRKQIVPPCAETLRHDDYLTCYQKWDCIMYKMQSLAKNVSAKYRKFRGGLALPDLESLQERSKCLVAGVTYKALQRRIKLRKQAVTYPTAWQGNLVTTLRKATDHFKTVFRYVPTDSAQRKEFFSRYISSVGLTETQRYELEKPYTLEEVEAITQEYSLKKSSPGDNGMPYSFFWKEFGVFGPWLVDVLNALHVNPGAPKDFQRMSMKLLPKKGDKRAFVNWRPISLTNTGYRLITAVVNRRLVKVLPQIVGQEQKGFIPGRDSKDSVQNLRLLREVCLRDNNPLSPESSLYQLDLDKAYDRLSHEYIADLLSAMNFGPNFRQFISNVNQGQTGMINVNRAHGMPFSLASGLRQGSPIAPSLFAICMEPLAQAVRQDLAGITIASPLGRQLNLKIQLYADDVIVMLKDTRDYHQFDHIWKQFSKISGCVLNTRKSHLVLFSGQDFEFSTLFDTPPDFLVHADINNLPNYRGKYLGVDYFSHDWGSRVSHMIDYLTQATMYGLPISVKTSLVNIYVYSKLYYWDQHDALSVEQIDQIEQSVRDCIHKHTPFRNLVPLKLLKGPKDLGFYGLIQLQTHLLGRRARWIYDLFTDASEPHQQYTLDFLRKFMSYLSSTTGRSWLVWDFLAGNSTPSGIPVISQYYRSYTDQLPLSEYVPQFFSRLEEALQAWFLVVRLGMDSSFAFSRQHDSEVKAQTLMHLRDVENLQVTPASFRRTGIKMYHKYAEPYVSPRIGNYLFEIDSVPGAMSQLSDYAKIFWQRLSRLHYRHPFEMDALYRFSHLVHVRLFSGSGTCQFCYEQYEVAIEHWLEDCTVVDLLWQRLRSPHDVDHVSVRDFLFPRARKQWLVARGRFLVKLEEMRKDAYHASDARCVDEWKEYIGQMSVRAVPTV